MSPTNKKFISKKSSIIKPKQIAEKLPATLDITSRYLAEISRYPLLSKEEEYELAKKLYDDNDQTAAQKLITSNLRFVVKIASEYTKFGLKLMDLVQEGNYGLLVAVKKFNPYRGVKLTSYAAWWIKRYIHDYMLSQWSMVKIGTTTAQKKLFYRLKQEQEKLSKFLEEEDTPKLLEHKIIANNLGVKEKEVAEMEMRLQGGDLSLDAPIGESEADGRFIDQLADKNPNIEEVLTKSNLQGLFNDELDKFIETLNLRDRYILEMRLMAEEPVSLRELGEKYNISRERARQLEERIKQKLKDFILAHHPNFEI